MKRSVLILPLLAACSGSYMVGGESIGSAGREEARVVVYRPSGVNAARAYMVYDGDQLMGFAENGCAFEYRCAPGEHLFMQLGSSGLTDTAVMATLESGRTYYLRSETETELFSLRLSLVPVRVGSPEMQRLQEDLDDCSFRVLVPENVEGFVEDSRERVASRLAHFRSVGTAECAVLEAADGILETAAGTPDRR